MKNSIHTIFPKRDSGDSPIYKQDKVVGTLLTKTQVRPSLYLDCTGTSNVLPELFPDVRCENHHLLPFLNGVDVVRPYWYGQLWWGMFAAPDTHSVFVPPVTDNERSALQLIEDTLLYLNDVDMNGGEFPQSVLFADGVMTSNVSHFREALQEKATLNTKNPIVFNAIDRVRSWVKTVGNGLLEQDEGWGDSLWGDTQIGHNLVVADLSMGDSSIFWAERHMLAVQLVNGLISNGGGTVFINEPRLLLASDMGKNFLQWLLVYGQNHNIRLWAADHDAAEIAHADRKWGFVNADQVDSQYITPLSSPTITENTCMKMVLPLLVR